MPDLKPFYGGTYFPPEPRQGLPTFNDLLRTIICFWRDKREQVEQDSEQIMQLIRKMYQHKPQVGAEGLSATFLIMLMSSSSFNLIQAMADLVPMWLHGQ